MDIKFERSGNDITARLAGEIDHHNAAYAREKLDEAIEREQAEIFRLDLSAVTFCDSSGLGLVMGRMKKCENNGSLLIITDPSKAAEKILQIAGIDKILKIERSIKT